jgi:hypothetical protein
MFVSVTRLRMRFFRHLPLIWWNTFLMQRQVVRSAGFVGGRLLMDAHRTYWTLTMWESEKAMKAFRGSGAHANAMPRLPKWCDEAAYAHWETSDGTVPEWPEAHEHLVKDGKLSGVENPSADHTARRFPKPRLKPLIGATLKSRN